MQNDLQIKLIQNVSEIQRLQQEQKIDYECFCWALLESTNLNANNRQLMFQLLNLVLLRVLQQNEFACNEYCTLTNRQLEETVSSFMALHPNTKTNIEDIPGMIQLLLTKKIKLDKTLFPHIKPQKKYSLSTHKHQRRFSESLQKNILLNSYKFDNKHINFS